MRTQPVQGHLEGSSVPDPYSHVIESLKMKATPCLHGNARAQSWSHPAALDRAFQKSDLRQTSLQRFGGACDLTWASPCLSWFTLGFALHRCRRCHRARRGARGASRVTNDAEELLQAAQLLQDLQKQWIEIQIEDVSKAQELMQREADLREDLKALPSSVHVQVMVVQNRLLFYYMLSHDITSWCAHVVILLVRMLRLSFSNSSASRLHAEFVSWPPVRTVAMETQLKHGHRLIVNTRWFQRIVMWPELWFKLSWGNLSGRWNVQQPLGMRICRLGRNCWFTSIVVSLLLRKVDCGVQQGWKFRGFFCFEVESLIQQATTEEIRTRQLSRSSVENGGTSLETFRCSWILWSSSARQTTDCRGFQAPWSPKFTAGQLLNVRVLEDYSIHVWSWDFAWECSCKNIRWFWKIDGRSQLQLQQNLASHRRRVADWLQQRWPAAHFRTKFGTKRSKQRGEQSKLGLPNPCISSANAGTTGRFVCCGRSRLLQALAGIASRHSCARWVSVTLRWGSNSDSSCSNWRVVCHGEVLQQRPALAIGRNDNCHRCSDMAIWKRDWAIWASDVFVWRFTGFAWCQTGCWGIAYPGHVLWKWGSGHCGPSQECSFSHLFWHESSGASSRSFQFGNQQLIAWVLWILSWGCLFCLGIRGKPEVWWDSCKSSLSAKPWWHRLTSNSSLWQRGSIWWRRAQFHRGRMQPVAGGRWLGVDGHICTERGADAEQTSSVPWKINWGNGTRWRFKTSKVHLST